MIIVENTVNLDYQPTMDVNLLYFTLHSTDPTAFTTWGAILIEDGEMESLVGSGNTELSALVEGLTTCLERFPTSLPIVIRSRHRQVLQLGKRWLITWKDNGWEDEACPTLIAHLMNAVEIRKIEWCYILHGFSRLFKYTD